jgi:thiamine kinase-like enzyme
MANAAMPRSSEEITPEWLTSALRSGGVVRDATVTAIERKPIGVGAGFLGELARIAVTYDPPQGDAPPSLIAKLPTMEPQSRAVGNLFRFYEREICFYNDIAREVELRTPRLYFSHMDVAGDEYLMLLEDLSLCATMFDEVAGCTRDAAELIVGSLARFHATWWESPRLAQLEWMPYINAPVHQSAEQSYQQAWAPFLEMMGERLSPAMLKIGEEMRTHVIDLLDAMEPAPRTIVHGDYRLDNLFLADGGEAIAAIDWQISSKGRGIFDVGYFLSSCIDADQRKATEEGLVRLWHETQLEHGIKGYAWEQAWHDYRLAVLYTWIYTVIGIGALSAANERGLSLFHEWVKRRERAISDLDAGELMPA